MKSILSSIFLATLIGCNSNPFEGLKTSTEPEPIRREVRVNLGIDVPAVMDFKEDRTGEYEVRFSVPEGEPILELEGMPAGAAWDPIKSVITWTPSFTQANDPSDYNVKTRVYPVKMILYSSSDLTQSIQETVLFKVEDTPRPIVVEDLSSAYSMREGEAKTLGAFSVVADDYAAADVRAELKDTAMGMKLVRSGARAEWSLVAEYGVDRLRVGNDCRSTFSCNVALNNTVILTGPDGRQHTEDFRINLTDVRQETRTSLATELVVKGDMSQAFTVVDANMEVAPRVTLVTTPPVGIFELRQVSAVAPESTYVLSWTDIPADATGQVYTIELSLCNSNYGSTTNMNRCRTHRMNLSVEERTIATPTIGRGDWGPELVKFFQFGKTLDHSISISAGSSAVRVRSTGITSSDPRDQVSLVGNQIKIKSENAGLKTMSVTVTNSVGGVAHAVFLYEVLPANWGENVILGPVSNAPEFAAIERLWGNTNRVYHGGHNLNSRALAFRKSVTVGTDTMQMPEIATDLNFFAKNMKKILVSSPLLANLPADIIAELNAKGLYLGKRATSVPGFKLEDYELEVVRELGLPTKKAGLKGLTTKESANPAFLEISLTSTDCKELFGLLKTGEEDNETAEQYVLGAACRLSGGRTIVVLGFEWSDMKLAQADENLLKRWFERMWE
jgi:hypothetical protein